MGFFDRFRAQPKWKHADAAVRLAGVEEIPLEEQALLVTLAREDADARVRRAAVRKVYDPALLKEVAARDQDAEVREEASGVLLDLAIGAFEDSTEAESLKALEHLDDQRHLAAVAKGASAEAISLAALSRLTDVKAIAGVARRADHAPTRLEALARVDDAEELFAIALRSEHRDVALAAVERVADPEHLKAVAGRAVQKAVARRARVLARTIEEQAAQAAAAEAQPAAVAPDWNAKRDKLCRVIEVAGGERDRRVIESRLASAETQWAQIEREGFAGEDQGRAARFAAACERARQAISRLKQEEADTAERVEQSAGQHAERVAGCERLEAIAAALGRRAAGAAAETIRLEDVPAQIEGARQAWAGLATALLSADEIERLDRRFERARSACQREAERCRTVEAKRARLYELVEQAEALASAPPSPAGSGLLLESPGTGLARGGQPGTAQRTRWSALKQEWTDLGGAPAAGGELATRFDAAQSSIARRDAEAREQEQRRQCEELERRQQMCERLEALAKAETLTLKDGERALRDLRNALDTTGSLAKKDRGQIAERLKTIQSALFPRVQELREADDWVRWANVGIQEDLCRQAEALREVSDPAEAARQLHELQQQWKLASAVPRDKAQGLWERFRKAADEVHARADAHFAQEATERAGNLERKDALCQQAEALAESKDWIKTAEAIKQLQKEWKAIGPVPRGHEKAVWERFRTACDRFFTRRREDLARRKEEWSANLGRKEALIAQAEALAETSDWDRGIEEIQRLQAEWKSVGPVRKSRSEEVWHRFRTACDRFFERYQQRDQIQIAANVGQREEICREIESLVPAADAQPTEPPDGLADRVSAIRRRWQQAPTLMPRDVLAQLTARYNQVLSEIVKAFPEPFRSSDLDADAIRRRAEELCARVENALPPETGQQMDESPASILAARLREALAANTIGGGVAVAEDDVRWKASVAAVREAQAAWAALGALPADVDRRFERACQRVLEAAEKRKR
jgi:hypothetical protein